MRSAHSGLSSSLRTSIARTSRAKISAGRESSIRGPAEVETDYERLTGAIIVERFARLDPLDMPAVLVAGHGPFCWGKTPSDAVRNSLVLEKIAKMAILTLLTDPRVNDLPIHILRKHFLRKHGPSAYYGQAGRPKPKTRRPKT